MVLVAARSAPTRTAYKRKKEDVESDLTADRSGALKSLDVDYIKKHMVDIHAI